MKTEELKDNIAATMSDIHKAIDITNEQ